MRRFAILLPLFALLASCALAQQGTLRPERVIITNRDTPVYPPDDLMIRNSSLDPRVQIGINSTSDRAVASFFNENDNLMIELNTAEAVSMLRLLADSPNADKVTGGISTGGTALDIGYFQIYGEDRASGLDAYTVIAGGDIDTNTVLVRTTNAGPGLLQFDDQNGTGGLVSLLGFDGAGASYSLEWPGTAPSGSSCGGVCILTIDDTTGAMSFAAQGSIGGSAPFIDTTSIVYDDGDPTKEIRFEASNLTGGSPRVVWFQDLANIFVPAYNTTNTWTASQTMQTIVPSTDGTYNLGTAGTTDFRWASGAFDDLTTEDLLFRRQGQSSHDFAIQNTASNTLILRDAGGGDVATWITAGTPRMISYLTLDIGSSGGTTGSVRLINTSGASATFSVNSSNEATLNKSFIPTASASFDLGSTSAYWRTYYVGTSILPDTSGGAVIGSTSLAFGVSYFTNLFPDAAGSGAVGDFTRWWSSITADTFRVQTAIAPFSTGAGALGTTSLYFANSYVNTHNVGSASATGNIYLAVSGTGSRFRLTSNGSNLLLSNPDVSSNYSFTLLDPSSNSTTVAAIGTETISGSNEAGLVFVYNESTTAQGYLRPSTLTLGGNQVVTTRQAAVTAPTGGATIDAEARTAINTIISRLQTHGLIN